MAKSKPAPTFGQQLRTLREAAGLTQLQLADASALAANSVARMERGELAPRWDTIQRLAKALGVGVERFAA